MSPYAAPSACGELGCPEPGLSDGSGRCATHRRTTSQRGYGVNHQAVRDELRATLPVPCGYGCGTVLHPEDRWHAAHRVDGHPEYGYVVACVPCNQRAKDGRLVPGGRGEDGLRTGSSLTGAIATRASQVGRGIR